MRTGPRCTIVYRHEPILVVYPEGAWHRCVDDTELGRMIAEHPEEGNEVGEHVFHRLGEGYVCAPGSANV